MKPSIGLLAQATYKKNILHYFVTDLATGEIVYENKVTVEGNTFAKPLGEYLAIVKALQIGLPVYSDSFLMRKWVHEKRKPFATDDLKDIMEGANDFIDTVEKPICNVWESGWKVKKEGKVIPCNIQVGETYYKVKEIVKDDRSKKYIVMEYLVEKLVFPTKKGDPILFLAPKTSWKALPIEGLTTKEKANDEANYLNNKK